MANKPSTPTPDVKWVLKKMWNVKIEWNDKNKKWIPEETTVAASLINELKELFSDRINVIILAWSIVLGSAIIWGIIYYEKNKTPVKATISEENIPQKRIKKIVPEEVVIEEKKEVQKQTPEKQEQSPKNEDPKKQALREEVLNTGWASISWPDDVKNLVEIIKEMNGWEKRK